MMLPKRHIIVRKYNVLIVLRVCGLIFTLILYAGDPFFPRLWNNDNRPSECYIIFVILTINIAFRPLRDDLQSEGIRWKPHVSDEDAKGDLVQQKLTRGPRPPARDWAGGYMRRVNSGKTRAQRFPASARKSQTQITYHFWNVFFLHNGRM